MVLRDGWRGIHRKLDRVGRVLRGPSDSERTPTGRSHINRAGVTRADKDSAPSGVHAGSSIERPRVARRLVSPRWRPVARLAALFTLANLAVALLPGKVRYNSNIVNPLGIEALRPIRDPYETVGLARRRQLRRGTLPHCRGGGLRPLWTEPTTMASMRPCLLIAASVYRSL